MKQIQITNPDKILYKKDKITKMQVIEYYNCICDYMFPYLDKRLISVIRCHSKCDKNCFYKKHPLKENEFIKTYKVEKQEYFYLKNKYGILYESQMGTIEFHTWASNVKQIDKPDIMTFDLDPDVNVSLEKLREGVLDLKSVLDNLNLKSFLKTSGGKGYHILVPFKSSVDFDKFYNFANSVAVFMEEKWPTKYTTSIRKEKRKGKIFIDFMRNHKGSTVVAPFSLRAKEKPTVSMPIDYKDLKKIAPNEITMFDALKRIKKHNPWEDFFKINQKLK